MKFSDDADNESELCRFIDTVNSKVSMTPLMNFCNAEQISKPFTSHFSVKRIDRNSKETTNHMLCRGWRTP
jgi:hypothetical protein